VERLGGCAYRCRATYELQKLTGDEMSILAGRLGDRGRNNVKVKGVVKTGVIMPFSVAENLHGPSLSLSLSVHSGVVHPVSIHPCTFSLGL
jgi:hypothetical protein